MKKTHTERLRLDILQKHGSSYFFRMKTLNVAIVGCGGIALANHLPGLALCPHTKVTAICDTHEGNLKAAQSKTGVAHASVRYEEIVQRDDIHAVIIATPNIYHAPIAHAAMEAGKHVLCEKPIAMNLQEAAEMYRAAKKAGVRHMTAFTYRFVPAMRFMAHMVQIGAVGEPFHIRTCRLQDWDTRSIGWRQTESLAGSGELGDMLSHRIDYAHLLIGTMTKVVADTRRFFDDRQGQVSDLEDWVGVLAKFQGRATGMLESSKVATGRGEGGKSPDYCEVNGSEGTLVYYLDQPHTLHYGKKGQSGLNAIPVPKDFLTWPGSKRDPQSGDPIVAFRYDQDVEFINAIREERECSPSFLDGARAQSVMDSVLESVKTERWVEVRQVE